jgi:hypothetical protein
MATDRDEQLRQQRELEEIRRSFAEMGARMGSMFEPTEDDEPERAGPPTPPPAPAGLGLQGRPRWWWAAAVVVLFVAGTAFGYLLPKGGGGSDSPSPPGATTTPSSRAQAIPTRPRAAPPSTVVPDDCLETAELADEVISRLIRNNRDNRLALALRDYTIASQACRREASP